MRPGGFEPGLKPPFDIVSLSGSTNTGVPVVLTPPVVNARKNGLAEELTKRLNIRHHFAALLGADTLPVRKPDAGHLLGTIKELGGNPSKSVLIGDTITDRNAAKNAWVPCILVTFGPDGRYVEDLEPEALLNHYNDLPGILNQLIAD